MSSVAPQPWIYLPLDRTQLRGGSVQLRDVSGHGRYADVDGEFGIVPDETFGHCLFLNGDLTRATSNVSMPSSAANDFTSGVTVVVWVTRAFQLNVGGKQLIATPPHDSRGGWLLVAVTIPPNGQPEVLSPLPAECTLTVNVAPGRPPREVALFPFGVPTKLARFRIYDRLLAAAEVEAIRKDDIGHALLVPVHLDALVLSSDRFGVSLAPDLSRLPYSGDVEVNASVANLSQEITPGPFQPPNFRLKAGVHLHWALPDALTRAEHGQDGTLFPVVPNRWLVTRTVRGVVRAWLVESDYLHSEQGDEPTGGVLALRPSGHGPGKKPYRRMGRAVSLDGPAATGAKAERFPRLTAVGDGDPTFAALYPRCHSVFGFCDEGATAVAGTRYDVVGWYDDLASDPLFALYKELTPANGAAPAPEVLAAAIEKRFKWRPEHGAGAGLPRRIFCYARLTLSAEETPSLDPQVSVGFANSGTEALSRHLARALDGPGRDQLEDQLEYVLLGSRLPEHAVQIGPQLRAARHAKGFAAVSGGSLWTIRPKNGADEEAAPPERMGDLNELNNLQRNLDRTREQIESLRRQLFADWHKYMICAYPPHGIEGDHPPADAVKAFIEDRLLVPLEQKVREAETLSGRRNTLRSRLESALDQSLVLQEVPAPRYYHPTEPVVLLAGPAVQPSDRHGQDGRLHADGVLVCHVIDAPRLSTIGYSSEYSAVADAMAKALTAITDNSPRADQIGFSTWRRQPWHPLLLDWEVEFTAYTPTGDAGSSPLVFDDYGVDILFGGPTPQTVNRFSGSSILVQHTRGQYRKAITDYLEDRILADYRKDKHFPLDGAVNLDVALDDVERWYKGKGHVAPDPILTSFRAYRLLGGARFLSQALSGFNDACLMLRQAPQLPIDEPIGFPAYRAFTARVRALVQRSRQSAPELHFGFHPRRSGILKVLRLRLIDIFGQVLDLRHEEPTLPLRPRFVQPARVDLRWQAGAHGDVESNASAASTPICGWLLPNHVDNSLMVHDADGRALGVIANNRDGRDAWQAAPGEAAGESVDRIANHHLKRFVRWLVGKQQSTWRHDYSYVGKVLSLIQAATENIEPEGDAERASPLFLLGRPLALARLNVGISLQGLPAVHQGWESLATDIGRLQRETAGFTAMKSPVRIGEHNRLDDGVVGYWRDGDDEFHWATESQVGLSLAPDGRTEGLCLLVDPLSSVHAVTGLLPTKDIRLPAEHCEPALKRIQLAHLVGPILTPDDSVTVPVPNEPDHVWSWIESKRGVPVKVALDPEGSAAMMDFAGPLRIREGWLQLRAKSDDTEDQ